MSVRIHEFYRHNGLRVLEIPVGKKCPVVFDWPNTQKPIEEVQKTLDSDSRFNKYGWILDDDHLVVDIDVHHPEQDGRISLLKLEQKLGYRLIDVCGAVVSTPSGGTHYYFRKPPESKLGKKFAEYLGIDFIAGKGKQVVAANSAHDSHDGLYSLSGTGLLTDAPESLLELIIEASVNRSFSQQQLTPDQERSGDEFNTTKKGLSEMIHALRSCGYEVWGCDDFFKFNRPGKTTTSDCSGHVGKVSKQGNYQLTCFSLSDQYFPTGESLAIFHAYSLLKHSGNHKDAAIDLYNKGFAEQSFSGIDISGIMEQANFTAIIRGESVSSGEPVFPLEIVEKMPYVMRLAFEFSKSRAVLFMPEASVMGILAMFSSILGRRVRDDYDSRTNPIIIGLASSGGGKNSQREANKLLLAKSGLNVLSGPERVGSPQGIVTAVHKIPSVLFQLDEAGELLKAINDPRSHLRQLPGLMMHMYSDCRSIWTGDAVSDDKRVKTINQPNPVYYGTATPESFYDNIQPEQMINGFLNRMIIFKCKSPDRRFKPQSIEPPEELLSWMRAWYSLRTSNGNLSDANADWPEPMVIEKTQEADDMHEAYADAVFVRHKGENQLRQALWSRAPEKEAKLALVHACCNGLPTRPPKITEASIEWAKKVINYSTSFMVWAAEEKASDSKIIKHKQQVLDKIQTGMTQTQVCRKTQRLCRNARERKEVLEELVASGAISFSLAENSYTKHRDEV
jgi:hypothetical protein